MIRATPLALCAALALLAGCGSKEAPAPETATVNAAGNDDVEALPSDGLAAPEGMAIESESNVPAETNGVVGSASGGNAM